MRLFYGFPISEDARDALRKELEQLRKSGTDMKLVEPENLHITLLFLGDVDEKDVDGYKKALDSMPKGAFHIQLSEIGAFPHKDSAKVVWAGIEPEENIINIHGVICSQLGSEETGYKPHITLARLKGKADEVVKKALGKQLSTPLKVDRVQLLESTLTPKGPKYRVVHEIRL